MSAPHGNPYFLATEIVNRLKAVMPISLTLHDPISGAPYTIERENILKSLVVDVPNLMAETQTLAMYYGEMARAQRAAARMAGQAERQFVAWKAKVAAEARAAAAKAGTKLTNDAAAEAYRTHADYEKMANGKTYYEELAGLFDDLKQGFRLKASMIEVAARTLGGDMKTRRAESIEELEAGAAATLAASGSTGSGRTARPL